MRFQRNRASALQSPDIKHRQQSKFGFLSNCIQFADVTDLQVLVEDMSQDVQCVRPLQKHVGVCGLYAKEANEQINHLGNMPEVPTSSSNWSMMVAMSS